MPDQQLLSEIQVITNYIIIVRYLKYIVYRQQLLIQFLNQTEVEFKILHLSEVRLVIEHCPNSNSYTTATYGLYFYKKMSMLL